MRLFIAICLPAEARRRLARAARALIERGGGRATREENFHLTLVFLGETENLDGAQRALHAVQSAPFSLTVSGLGRFGDVYWAGVEPSPALTALQARLACALGAEGFALERRPFTPHLTLCRGFRPTAAFDPEKTARAMGALEFSVDRICLMQSHRVQGVLTYTELTAQPLRA